METCRLYTELEALRFCTTIVCEFNVEEAVDIFSFHVPPLIVQPFIENAIWHGVLPKEGGKVSISVTRQDDDVVQCAIEDDGIGREISRLNKLKQSTTYESKGMKLVMNRLNLFNTIHNYGGSIEVIDKKDDDGHPTGTLVIITLKKQA